MSLAPSLSRKPGQFTLVARARRRFVKKVVSLAYLAPLYGDSLMNRLRAKTALVAKFRYQLWMRLRLSQSLARISHDPRLQSARNLLLELGIGEGRISDILQQHGNGRPLAAFDQNNRVASFVGPIPLFESDAVAWEDFEPRQRNQVELVVFQGTLAIRKVYSDERFFRNEVIALQALRSVEGVPRLLGANRRHLEVHLSFTPARNLGAELSDRGATIEQQQQAAVEYPGPGQWSPADSDLPARKQCIDALARLHDSDTVTALGEKLLEIHRAGVVIGDIKHGNALFDSGPPAFCDFETARLFPKDDARALAARNAERDRFNYCFGARLPTLEGLTAETERLRSRRHDLLYAPVYHGKGSGIGQVGSIEFGTGKWRFIANRLPEVRGRRVLDLGCNNAVIPLEMLRAGAHQVTAFELDPDYARLARINHAGFELNDNRRYDFHLVEANMLAAADLDLAPFDIATAFCSLYYLDPEDMAQLCRRLSEDIGTFVVQANENTHEHQGEMLRRCSLSFLRKVLAQNGFPQQRVVSFSYYDRPLIVAQRSADARQI